MQKADKVIKPVPRSNVKSFFINGALMTLCSIILRSIAVSFNIYVANVAGSEAVGLYTLLGSVYGFALTLSLSGINLAMTRLVSEALALGDESKAVFIIKRATAFAFIFGSVASVLLFLLSEPLSHMWLNESRAVKPLRRLAVCLPAVSLSSVFNGYFTAVRRAYKNALANLAEMTAKISFTVLLFSRYIEKDVETACTVLVLGSVFAEICSFAINLTLYCFDRFRNLKSSTKKPLDTGISKSILSISLPVALTSYVRSALLSIEHALVPKGLYKFGSDKSTALSAYGTLTGMALPVINFPYALIGSFTSLLIPEIAESRTRGDKRHIKYIIYRTYQSCLTFAFCIGGIFFAFADHLSEILYSSVEAGRYIRLLSLLVPVMYTDTSTDAILKGLGEQIHCMKVNIADALLSVLLVYLLVPRYGIMGYIATIYIAEIVNAALSIGRLLTITGFRFPLAKLLFLPLFCAVGAGAISNILLRLIHMPTSPLSTILGSMIFILLYFIFMSVTGTLSNEDAEWIRSLIKKQKPL